MSSGKHSRIGIVLWTANKYISEHPQCGLSEVMRHTCRTLGVQSVSYMSMSAGRCKFWKRVKGRAKNGTRVQWLYSVNSLGKELAESPKPRSLQEVAARSAQRRRSDRHEADWATDAQPGELLTPRRKHADEKYGMYAVRVGEELNRTGPDGVLVYNDRYATRVMRDDVLIFHGPGEGFRVERTNVCGEIDRPINFGRVNVISPVGELLSVDAVCLKTLQRRKFTRPTLNRN